jgi:hypothetical protein
LLTGREEGCLTPCAQRIQPLLRFAF